jgi:hypothetical protein
LDGDNLVNGETELIGEVIETLNDILGNVTSEAAERIASAQSGAAYTNGGKSGSTDCDVERI